MSWIRSAIRKITHALGVKPLPVHLINKDCNIMGDQQDCSPHCGACCVALTIDACELQKPKGRRCEFLTEDNQCTKFINISPEKFAQLKQEDVRKSSLAFCAHWTCRKANPKQRWILYEWLQDRAIREQRKTK